MPRKERKSPTARFVTVLAGVAAALLAAELFSRSFLKQPWMDRPLWYQFWRRPTPYTMFSSSKKREIPPRAAGEHRIFISGGSTVRRGRLARNIQEDLIDRGDRRAKVYNFGVDAQVSGQELSRLVFEMVDQAPDLVVFYGGGNDIKLAREGDPRPGYPYDFILHERHPFRLEPGRYPGLTMLAYESNVLRTIFPGYFRAAFAPFESLREEAGYETPEWRGLIAWTYVSNLMKAQKVAEAHGIRFAALFQPLVFYKDPSRGGELDWQGTLAAESALQIREMVRGEAAARRADGLVFADLSDALDGFGRQAFSDDIHVSRQANEIMAKTICDTLAALGVLKRGAGERRTGKG